jgi:hypothetical protein
MSIMSPEVRSWIDNVLVPAMVREYVAEHRRLNSLASPSVAVPECETNSRFSAEGIQ